MFEEERYKWGPVDKKELNDKFKLNLYLSLFGLTLTIIGILQDIFQFQCIAIAYLLIIIFFTLIIIRNQFFRKNISKILRSLRFRLKAIWYVPDFLVKVSEFSKIIHSDVISEISNKFGNGDIKYKIQNYNIFLSKLRQYTYIKRFTINQKELFDLMYEFEGSIDSYRIDCINKQIKYININKIYGYRASYNSFLKNYISFADSYFDLTKNIKNNIGYTYSNNDNYLKNVEMITMK